MDNDPCTTANQPWEGIAANARRLWSHFRGSSVWRLLRRVNFLRSSVYLAMELCRTARDAKCLSREIIDREFRLHDDPFHYRTSPGEVLRFAQQTGLLDSARRGAPFQRALEIGCAEGVFTEVIAERSQSLMVFDISPTALAKTRERRTWGEFVQFQEWDLRSDGVPGTFDLIVAAGVLEYLQKPREFRMVRAKLVGAVSPGGYLLVQSTKVNPVIENAWWGKYLIRGERINRFFREDEALRVVDWLVGEIYVISLFQKVLNPQATRQSSTRPKRREHGAASV